MTTNPIAAFIAANTPIGAHYALVSIPGTELSDVCRACGTAGHEIQNCPAIRAEMEDASDASDVQRDLAPLIDTHGTVEGLREQLARGDEVVGALTGALDKTVTYLPFCECESCAAIDSALVAARAWLRRAAR